MHISSKMKPWLFFAAVFLIAALACSSSTAVATKPAPANTQNETEPTKAPQPTDAPKPTDPPTALPIGLSRNNPFPKSDLVSTPHWNLQVLETKRGEDAWKDLQAANAFNKAAPEGMEYLLIRLHAKSKYTDSTQHVMGGCDFNVTGDRFIQYACGVAAVEPDPILDSKLAAGAEREGWIVFMVAQGEGNLILIFTETFNYGENTIRAFIALSDGASLSVSPDLSTIKPNDLGKERNNPAKRADKLITDDWEISVMEVFRGDEAWKRVQEANQFNKAADEGMEYIVAKIHTRYIGTKDGPLNIGAIFFKTIGSAGVLYKSASAVVDPKPSLINISLYPGGEYEGWVVLQRAIGETGVSLVFEPLFDFSGKNKRFISLGP